MPQVADEYPKRSPHLKNKFSLVVRDRVHPTSWPEHVAIFSILAPIVPRAKRCGSKNDLQDIRLVCAELRKVGGISKR